VVHRVWAGWELIGGVDKGKEILFFKWSGSWCPDNRRKKPVKLSKFFFLGSRELSIVY